MLWGRTRQADHEAVRALQPARTCPAYRACAIPPRGLLALLRVAVLAVPAVLCQELQAAHDVVQVVALHAAHQRARAPPARAPTALRAAALAGIAMPAHACEGTNMW